MCPIRRLVTVSLVPVLFASLSSARVSAEQKVEATASQELQLYSRPPMRLWPLPFVLPALPVDNEVVEEDETFTRRAYREVFVYPERALWWQIETADGSEGWIYLGPVVPNQDVPELIQVVQDPGESRDE